MRMRYLEYEKLNDREFYYNLIQTVIEYCDRISLECYGISYEEFCESNYGNLKNSIDIWGYSEGDDDNIQNLFWVDINIDERTAKWLRETETITYFDMKIESGENRYPIDSIYFNKMDSRVFELKRFWNECCISDTLFEMIEDKTKR